MHVRYLDTLLCHLLTCSFRKQRSRFEHSHSCIWLSASSNQRKHQHKRSHSADQCCLCRLRTADFCHHAFALTTASTTHDIDGSRVLSVRFLCFYDPMIAITLKPTGANALEPLPINTCQNRADLSMAKPTIGYESRFTV